MEGQSSVCRSATLIEPLTAFKLSDPGDFPAYSISEAAHYLGVARSTKGLHPSQAASTMAAASDSGSSGQCS